MDYRNNIDHRDCHTGNGLSYNQVIDLVDVEPSGDHVEPVDLTEVKNFCKIDVSEDDTLIEMLITACRIECEQLTNIGFVNREVVLIQNNGNGGAYLPLGPNGTITSVVNEQGDAVTGYKITGTAWKQILEPWYRHLVITYNTGHTTLPANLKLALLECIFYRYDERKVRENAHPPIYLDLLKQVARIW